VAVDCEWSVPVFAVESPGEPRGDQQQEETEHAQGGHDHAESIRLGDAPEGVLPRPEGHAVTCGHEEEPGHGLETLAGEQVPDQDIGEAQRQHAPGKPGHQRGHRPILGSSRVNQMKRQLRQEGAPEGHAGSQDGGGSHRGHQDVGSPSAGLAGDGFGEHDREDGSREEHQAASDGAGRPVEAGDVLVECRLNKDHIGRHGELAGRQPKGEGRHASNPGAPIDRFAWAQPRVTGQPAGQGDGDPKAEQCGCHGPGRLASEKPDEEQHAQESSATVHNLEAAEPEEALSALQHALEDRPRQHRQPDDDRHPQGGRMGNLQRRQQPVPHHPGGQCHDQPDDAHPGEQHPHGRRKLAMLRIGQGRRGLLRDDCLEANCRDQHQVHDLKQRLENAVLRPGHAGRRRDVHQVHESAAQRRRHHHPTRLAKETQIHTPAARRRDRGRSGARFVRGVGCSSPHGSWAGLCFHELARGCERLARLRPHRLRAGK